MPAETHPEEGINLRQGELDKAMTHGKYWRWSTWGVTSLLGVSILGNVYLGSLPKWKPYYVEVDRCGGDVRVVGAAPETFTPPQLAAHKTIRRFVEGLRMISPDLEITKKNWREIEHQVTQKGSHLLDEWRTTYNPLGRTDPVTVENIQVFPRTATTYYVRWQENVYSGKSTRRERTSAGLYGALVTVERREPRTAEEREDAPLGLFFDHWTVNKEQ